MKYEAEARRSNDRTGLRERDPLKQVSGVDDLKMYLRVVTQPGKGMGVLNLRKDSFEPGDYLFPYIGTCCDRMIESAKGNQ